LSIQFYGQPFFSRGTYSDFNFVNTAAAQDLGERLTLFNTSEISRINNTGSYLIYDPDFAFVPFRSNLAVGWEYRPGSEIFLDWSQGVNGLGDPMDSLGRSLDGQILNQKKTLRFLLRQLIDLYYS